MDWFKILAMSLVCGVTSAFLRCINFIYNFDGLFLENQALSTISVLICFVPFIYALVSIFMTGNTWMSIESHKGQVQSSFSFWMGILVLIVSVILVYNYLVGNSQDETVTGISLELPYAIMAIILGFYLSLSGVIHSNGSDEFYLVNPAFEMIPVVFAVFNLIYAYVHHSISLVMTENIFCLVSSSAVLLAVLQKAKFMSKIDDDKISYKKSIMFSSLALTISIACFFSSVVLFCINKEEITKFPMTTQLINLALTFNTMVFLFFVKRKNWRSRIKLGPNDKRYR